LRLQLKKDDGLTLVEVIATVILMFIILPSIAAVYMNAAKMSEIGLHRLRCLGLARQEVEFRKSEGFEYLRDVYLQGAPTAVISQPNFADSNIDLETYLEMTTISYEETVLDAIRLSVVARDNLASVEIYAIVVSGGY